LQPKCYFAINNNQIADVDHLIPIYKYVYTYSPVVCLSRLHSGFLAFSILCFNVKYRHTILALLNNNLINFATTVCGSLSE